MMGTMKADERREHVNEIAQELLRYAIQERGYDAGAVQDACAGLAGELGVLRAIAMEENVADRLGEVARVVLAHGHQRWAAERMTVVAGRC
jgi:hypothetical protein